MTFKIIDPHLHFFALEHGNYHWLKSENPPNWARKNILQRNFDESDIQLNNGLETAGYLHVEAGFDNEHPEREVDFWTEKATLPMSCIQTCDLKLPHEAFEILLSKAKNNDAMVGVRHIIDDDSSVLTQENVAKNLSTLNSLGLIFELQVNLADDEICKQLFNHLEQCKDLKVSLNHAGFPPAKKSLKFSKWQANLSILLEHRQLAVKCSGLEMTNEGLNLEDLLHFSDSVLNAVPQAQAMYASNFPVLTLAMSYQHYWELVLDTTRQLGVNSESLVYQNAAKFYDLL